MKINFDFNDNVEMHNEFILVPSGSFVGYESNLYGLDYSEIQKYGRDDELLGSINLYNPMKIPDAQIDSEIIFEESRDIAEKLFSNFENSESVKIKRSDLTEYADQLIKLGIKLKSIPYDILLCPLRGALKPTNYLKTMNIIDSFNWLPFTAASSGDYDRVIIKFLKSILEKYTPNADFFNISVIDTAIGGYGVSKLTDILIDLKKEYSVKSNWIVNYFLLYPPNADTHKIDSVTKKNKEDLKFIVNKFEVHNLIVEDWDAAIGLKVNFQENAFEIKNSIAEGRIILIDADTICVVDSNEMSKFVDTLFSSELSEAIQTHPGLTFEKEVWQDYINR